MTSYSFAKASIVMSIGWGIIGASSIVRAHMADAIRRPSSEQALGKRRKAENGAYDGGSTIVAIHSSNALRARMFSDVLQIPHAYSNLEQMLARRDIQCVYVANHPGHHAHAVLAALDAGKHVLCEAPLALDMASVEKACNRATLRGLLLGINAPWRADPAMQRLKQLIVEQEIGDLLGGRIVNAGLLPLAQQGWRLLPNGGGVHFDRTQRNLDLLSFLTQQEVGEVYAVSSNQILGTRSKLDVPEDLVSTVTLDHAGPSFQLYDSFLTPHIASSVEIFGSNGCAVATDWFDANKPTSLAVIRYRQQKPIVTPHVDPYTATVEAFTAAIHSGSRLLATGDDGRYALGVTLAVQESFAKHRPITLRR